MTVWFHLSTILKRHYALRIAGIFMLCVALTTTLFFSSISSAAPGINKTLGFQGRLATASGSVVPDGHYNIQFKIYQDGAGTAVDNPGGTLKWHESYVNNNSDSGVDVKDGYFSVDLGSITPFGTSIDWNQDTLFVSMNVAGVSASCTTFGTTPCAADGEMLPMKRITATPNAINSEQLGGKTSSDFTQLGQGVQNDASNNSSIFINKTGTGNLLQLQAGGSDAFTLNNTGSITLGSTADQSISLSAAASGAGKALAVSSGAAASGSNLGGGDLTLQGGAGDGTGTSGNVVVKANGSDTTGTLQVQNAANENVFNVDTTNTSISVGSLGLSSSTSSQAAPVTSLWDTVPADGSNYNDAVPVNVGTTFKSDSTGYVTGVKFYSPTNGNTSGTNIGKLWACNNATCSLASGGTELASVTFPADSTSGWKTANFSTPVYISANTYYIVSYLSQNGIYHASSHYFDTNYDSAPLHAPGQSITENGSFIVNSGAFPNNTNGSNTNYWVDVAFRPDTKTDQISTGNGLDITSGGPMRIGPDSQSLSLQGSAINIAATSGGNVTMQGGDATVSNGNGGSVLLSGGAGRGTGASGLVVMTTPTFSTTQNDANCFTTGSVVASDCTVSQSTVDNSSAVMVGFSASGKTATLPDPTITTAGRIIYVMAAGGSQAFTLKTNVGDAAEQSIPMQKNTTATMIWNGTDWTVAGSGSTTLQSAYDNTPQGSNSAEIMLNNNTGSVAIHDSSTSPVASTLLEVKSAADTNLFSVNSNVTSGTENATDGNVHDAADFTTNWPAVGSSSISRITSDGQEASDSAQVAAGTGASNGIKNKLSVAPPINSHYRASVYTKLVSGSAFTDFKVRYSPDGGSTFVDCTNYSTQTVVTTGWAQITCDIDTGAITATDPYVYLVQPTSPASARTFLVDTFSFTLASNSTPNVKIGSGADSGTPTLFTLDKSATAPTAADNDALLGSMYYDTGLGKVQCYEATGWGTCGASPDSFVTISPEYSNAVMNGTDIGTITSDLCSDTLNINDGSSGQPTICGTNETYNFYKWTSTETSDQTRSIFVTYQLPATFKGFVTGSTSLLGRTDDADSSVGYQIYRDNGSGLTSCGSAMSVSTGSQSSWQKKATSGGGDPSTCGFVAGDSVLFRINLTAKNSANAYVSNLSFVFNNN